MRIISKIISDIIELIFSGSLIYLLLIVSVIRVFLEIPHRDKGRNSPFFLSSINLIFYFNVHMNSENYSIKEPGEIEDYLIDQYASFGEAFFQENSFLLL